FLGALARCDGRQFGSGRRGQGQRDRQRRSAVAMRKAGRRGVFIVMTLMQEEGAHKAWSDVRGSSFARRSSRSNRRGSIYSAPTRALIAGTSIPAAFIFASAWALTASQSAVRKASCEHRLSILV